MFSAGSPDNGWIIPSQLTADDADDAGFLIDAVSSAYAVLALQL